MYRTVLFVAAFVCVLGLAVVAQPATAQGQNLLQNPGFEGSYSAYLPRTAQEHADCPTGICNTVQIPSGWSPWWIKEQGSDANPEYKPAAPFGERIRSGGNAAQYFTFHRTHKAGFYQQVTVPADAVVQFSIWGQTWITNEDGGASDHNAPINMRIGIDPRGGTNPYSPDIVWSGTVQPYDAYQQFVIQAQAVGNRVTVFTYSAPQYPMKHNDVYWDDASLLVVNQQAAPPPPSAEEPPPQEQPAAPSGQTHVVQPGETLSAIARQYGITVAELAAVNNIANLNLIHSGQVLALPGGSETPAAETQPAPGGVSATTQVNLRLRSGPNTNTQILDVAPSGTTVEVLGRNAGGDWIRVNYQGQVGWMAAWYTSLSGGTIADLPVQ